jgi:pyruvate dehydrogenase E1 component alpha subunit
MTEHTTAQARRATLRERTALLERMTEIRIFEDRVKDLFFEGIVHGTTHTCQGQEAIAVGMAAVTQPTDHVTCTYRGHGVALAAGLTPETVLAEIMGRTGGPLGGVGGSMHLSDPDVGLLPTFAIVGAGIPVAAGAGLTAQVLGTDAVALSVFGDGATNIGAFHEGLNLASIWQLPVVFICENNIYGEYSRIDRTTPITDLAERASSYAMPSQIVDGQDIDMVMGAIRGAVDHARSGGGPTLLEMKTYRYAGHSRADLATYRPEGELEQWKLRDPLTIFRRRLAEEGTLDEQGAEEMRARVAADIDDVIERVKASPEPGLDAMFRNVLAPAH